MTLFQKRTISSDRSIEMNTTIVLFFLGCIACFAGTGQPLYNYNDPAPFGKETKYARESDNAATGEWWNVKLKGGLTGYDQRASKWFQSVERDQALAFALYTQDHSVLKLTAQCFPLLPDEPKVVSLEFKVEDKWISIDQQPVQYPGWSVHFRVDDWDGSKNVPYRDRKSVV